MYLFILASAIVMSGGFVLLHYSLAHPSKELKMAGWSLVIGGIATLTSYYVQFPEDPATGGNCGSGGKRQCHHTDTPAYMSRPMPQPMPQPQRMTGGMPAMPSPANGKMTIEAPPMPAATPMKPEVKAPVPAPMPAPAAKPAAEAPKPAPKPPVKKSDAFSPAKTQAAPQAEKAEEPAPAEKTE